MKDPEIFSLILIMGLPLLLAYLLGALRIFERHFNRNSSKEERTVLGVNVINLRDAALVTLALDFSEMLNSYLYLSMNEFGGERQDLLLVGLLIMFHLFVLFIGLSHKKRQISEVSYSKSLAFNRLLQLYFAITILMTNAVTIKGLMGVI